MPDFLRHCGLGRPDNAIAGTSKASGHASISVSLAELGITGQAKVRDLWKRSDLGDFKDTFTQDIPLHGAGLYRISPQP